jgi:hypothetical protein
MSPEEIGAEAIARLNKRITNEIFLIIQSDRELMQSYLRAVEVHGLEVLNQRIGKKVKAAYHLRNMNNREDSPSCTLIQSHQTFE